MIRLFRKHTSKSAAKEIEKIRRISKIECREKHFFKDWDKRERAEKLLKNYNQYIAAGLGDTVDWCEDYRKANLHGVCMLLGFITLILIVCCLCVK